MKSFCILGVLLCSFAYNSGAYSIDDETIAMKNPDENEIGHGSLMGGSSELMPTRDLSTQEVKNLIYLAMHDYFENKGKSLSNIHHQRDTRPTSNLPSDSVKILLRPKRFIQTGRTARDTATATNSGGSNGPILNFWRQWRQRRRNRIEKRIERRRQRWQNFVQRQQQFIQNMGRRTAQTTQRIQSMNMHMNQGGIIEAGGGGVAAGSGHRIVLNNRVPPTGQALTKAIQQVDLPKTT